MSAKTILFLLPAQREHIDSVIDELWKSGFTSQVVQYEASTTVSALEAETSELSISLIVYPDGLFDGESIGIRNHVSEFIRIMSRRGIPALPLATELGGPFDDALVFSGGVKNVVRQIVENVRTPEQNSLWEEWRSHVETDGEMLIHAPEFIRADRDIVLMAIKSVPYVFQFAAQALLSDRELAMECVGRNGWMLEHLPVELRADKEIVLRAVQAKFEAIKFASSELQKDPDVMSLAK